MSKHDQNGKKVQKQSQTDCRDCTDSQTDCRDESQQSSENCR